MIKWIKDLRSTERGRTLFKFGLYLSFLFFVIVLCLVAGAMKGPNDTANPSSNRSNSSSKENSHLDDADTEKPKTYFEKQKLFEEKYDFTYEVFASGRSTSFMGEYDHGKTDGFKESEGLLLHYEIENGIPYRKELFQREEMTDLYDGMDATLFDVVSLFEKLNSGSATVINDGTNKTYNYELEDGIYRVVTDEEYITRIEIIKENDKYDFSFKF